MHEARALEEMPDEMMHSDVEVAQEEHGWRTSRRVPIILFASAILLFIGVTYIAKQFQSEENLQGIIIEGNNSLMNSEVLSLAGIDVKKKFYEIDLRQIEHQIERHGLVRHATLRRETHPNRIVIHVDEREPIAMVRSQSGEPILVDREYRFFLPKKLSGLKDPEKLLSVPLLGGVTERDTTFIIQMAKIVQMIRTTNDGALKNAIGELRRTPTWDFVIYTAATNTPIFIGSPRDEKFETTLEADASKARGKEEHESLFTTQIKLLAQMWHSHLREDLWKNHASFVDARFDGQIVVKRRSASSQHNLPAVDTTKSKVLAVIH
ncbi:MAG: FtsQ-type POTRA domain-containing protein [bacterium]